MKIDKPHVYILIFLIAGMYLVCDAPRNNPFDPQNPSYPFAVLSGRVLTLSVPHEPIPKVSIAWRAGSLFTQTDEKGHFTFQNIKPENGWLFTNKEGFLTDSVHIEWLGKKERSIEIFMNAAPHLDSLTIYSIVLNRYPALQSYRAVIEAKISDRDNDIDSVYITNQYAGLKKYLTFNVSKNQYEKTFSNYDLHLASMDEIIGHDFDLFVVDKFGHTLLVGEAGIRRVIHQEVQFKAPANSEVVSSRPRLTWKPFDPGFPFYFIIQVYTNEISPQLVWEKSKVPADSTSVTVETTLGANDYFWIIWCVDEFQNRSRSKPASFTVR